MNKLIVIGLIFFQNQSVNAELVRIGCECIRSSMDGGCSGSGKVYVEINGNTSVVVKRGGVSNEYPDLINTLYIISSD